MISLSLFSLDIKMYAVGQCFHLIIETENDYIALSVSKMALSTGKFSRLLSHVFSFTTAVEIPRKLGLSLGCTPACSLSSWCFG